MAAAAAAVYTRSRRRETTRSRPYCEAQMRRSCGRCLVTRSRASISSHDRCHDMSSASRVAPNQPRWSSSHRYGEAATCRQSLHTYKSTCVSVHGRRYEKICVRSSVGMLVCHGLSSAAAAAGDAGDAAAPTADAAGEDDDLLTLRLEKKGLRSESDDEVERRGEPRLLKADDDEEDEVADSSKSGGGMTRSGIGGRHAMAGGRCRFYRVSDAIATTRTTIRLYGRERHER